MAKSNSEPFIVAEDEREEILSRKKTHVFYDEWCDWIIGFSSADAGEIAKGLAFAFRGEEYESPSQTANILLKNAVRIIRENREDYVIATAKKIRGAKNRFAESDDGVPLDIHSTSNGVPMDKDGVSVHVNVPVIDSVSVTDNVLDLKDKTEKKEDAYASKKEIIDALMAKWNSYTNRGHIPLVRSVVRDGKTWKSALARVEENGIEDAAEVIQMVFDSSYLRGEVNGWFAKFDWVFLPSNYEKVKNGNYTDSPTTRTQNAMQKQNDMLADWVEEYDSMQYGGNGA